MACWGCELSHKQRGAQGFYRKREEMGGKELSKFVSSIAEKGLEKVVGSGSQRP